MNTIHFPNAKVTLKEPEYDARDAIREWGSEPVRTFQARTSHTVEWNVDSLNPEVYNTIMGIKPGAPWLQPFANVTIAWGEPKAPTVDDYWWAYIKAGIEYDWAAEIADQEEWWNGYLRGL